MYAVVVEFYGNYGGVIPAGNAGMQKLHNKTRKGWLSETETMRRNTTGNVYVIPDFTQDMCEMTPRHLVAHVMSHVIACL